MLDNLPGLCYTTIRKGKEIKTMNELREKLIDRMIHIYGFEHELVITFAELCESTWIPDDALTAMVESHERYPVTED